MVSAGLPNFWAPYILKGGDDLEYPTYFILTSKNSTQRGFETYNAFTLTNW